MAAYLGAALLAVKAADHSSLSKRARDRAFWQITAALLCFLGINELLDLQALITDMGRAHAKAYGWYGEHRQVQYIFVTALGVGALLAGSVMV